MYYIIYQQVTKTKIEEQKKEGVQKVFGTLDLFVSLLETEIKYPILQGGILPFWTPSSAFVVSDLHNVDGDIQTMDPIYLSEPKVR